MECPAGLSELKQPDSVSILLLGLSPELPGYQGVGVRDSTGWELGAQESIGFWVSHQDVVAAVSLPQDVRHEAVGQVEVSRGEGVFRITGPGSEYFRGDPAVLQIEK